MSEVLHSPQVAKPKRFSLWGLLQGETVLTSQTVTGEPAVVRVPHALIGSILVLILALVSGGYWLVSTVTKIDTKLDSVTRHQERIDRHLETQKAYIDAHTSQVKFMQGLMTRDQQRAVSEYERQNPKPKLPELPEEN